MIFPIKKSKLILNEFLLLPGVEQLAESASPYSDSHLELFHISLQINGHINSQSTSRKIKNLQNVDMKGQIV